MLREIPSAVDPHLVPNPIFRVFATAVPLKRIRCFHVDEIVSPEREDFVSVRDCFVVAIVLQDDVQIVPGELLQGDIGGCPANPFFDPSIFICVSVVVSEEFKRELHADASR
jgi:hypothetical protein